MDKENTGKNVVIKRGTNGKMISNIEEFVMVEI